MLVAAFTKKEGHAPTVEEVRDLIAELTPARVTLLMHGDDDENLDDVADSVANSMIRMMVEAFTKKEGRAPTEEEARELIAELTPARVTTLMRGQSSVFSP